MDSVPRVYVWGNLCRTSRAFRKGLALFGAAFTTFVPSFVLVGFTCGQATHTLGHGKASTGLDSRFDDEPPQSGL